MKCQVSVDYLCEGPPMELTMKEISPGLCVGPNPAYVAGNTHRPKYAVVHKTSGLIIRAVPLMRQARELVVRLAPLLDWTRAEFTYPELRKAGDIAKEY